DQAIPTRDGGHQVLPEVPVSPSIEILDRHTLLFHPGVVAEVEDPLTIDMSQFQHTVIGESFQMAGEDFAGADVVEARGMASGQKTLGFACVQRRAVGRNRHDDVVRTKIEMLRELDGANDVGETGNPDPFELAY